MAPLSTGVTPQLFNNQADKRVSSDGAISSKKISALSSHSLSDYGFAEHDLSA
jgi:hypothetical protein